MPHSILCLMAHAVGARSAARSGAGGVSASGAGGIAKSSIGSSLELLGNKGPSGARKGESDSASVLPDIADIASLTERLETRGRSDAIALHRQYHDARTHARFQPRTDTSQRLYAMAEQPEVELLGCDSYAGVGRNLDAALDSRYRNLLNSMQATRSTLDTSQSRYSELNMRCHCICARVWESSRYQQPPMMRLRIGAAGLTRK